MNNLKKLSMASAILGLCAASSFGDVKIDSNLTISGFLDMSTVIPGSKNVSATFDQFEVDFMYKYGSHISARADIAHGGLGGGVGTVGLETGYITYSDMNMSVSVGRFLSVSGFEAAEPTATYQQSYNDALLSVYGTYENGLNVTYSSDMYALYGAIVSDVWTGVTSAGSASSDMEKPGFEAQVALMPMKEVTAKVTYLTDVMTDSTGDFHKSVVNAWASYATGPLLVGAEFDYIMNNTAKDDNGIGYMAMGNYKLTDKITATVRYSGITTKLGGPASIGGLAYGPKKTASEIDRKSVV